MFASPIQPYRPKHLIGPGGAVSPCHRYLNMCALAVAVFVAVALLASIGAEKGNIRSPALSENGHAEVVLEKLRFSPQTLSVPVGRTFKLSRPSKQPSISICQTRNLPNG